MLKPRPGWLVYLIIATLLLIFAYSYRERYDVRRLLIGGGRPTPGVLDHGLLDKPPQDLEPPQHPEPSQRYESSLQFYDTPSPSLVPASPTSTIAQGAGPTTQTTATSTTSASTPQSTTTTATRPTIDPNAHPIDTLVANAGEYYDELKKKSTAGVSAAAKAYRERRGRHPPPMFDKWVEYAEANGALMIEDMFDQIYHDLEPFWGVEAHQIRTDAITWPYVISVRGGKAETHAEDSSSAVYLNEWLSKLQEIDTHLPDVDMAFNIDNHPHLLVPWVKMTEIMKKSKATRSTTVPSGSERMVKEFAPLEPVTKVISAVRPELWKNDTNYWWLARHACPETSGARGKDLDEDFSTPPEFDLGHPQASLNGYVANWTVSKSVCEHPMLRNQHGALVSPGSNSALTDLFPLFGHSKMQDVNNDILVPPIQYLLESGTTGEGDAPQPWAEKYNRVLWRGRASGGVHDETNWTRFHRHRLVAMLNGTLVAVAEGHDPEAHVPNAGSQAQTTASSSSTVSAAAGSDGTTSSVSAATKDANSSDNGDASTPATAATSPTADSASAATAATTSSSGETTSTSSSTETGAAADTSSVYANPYNVSPGKSVVGAAPTADHGPAQATPSSSSKSLPLDGPASPYSLSAAATSTDAVDKDLRPGVATTASTTTSLGPSSMQPLSSAAPVVSSSASSSMGRSGYAGQAPGAAGALSGPAPGLPDAESSTQDDQANTVYKRDLESPNNFPLPADASAWPLSALSSSPSKLGPWISSIADVGFVDFMCDQGAAAPSADASKCAYLDPYYAIVPFVNISEFYGFKYLLDVDAEAFSIRFRNQLRSGSVPIKGTIFSEWHDSRLVAWKHFVPMDNTFIDIYGILEYFVGYNDATGDEVAGHDSVAQEIAREGKDWAEQVLRKEDMLIYMYRLILEYARLCDERRERMGYFDDLL